MRKKDPLILPNARALRLALAERIWSYDELARRTGSKTHGGTTKPAVSAAYLKKMTSEEPPEVGLSIILAVARGLEMEPWRVTDPGHWERLPEWARPQSTDDPPPKGQALPVCELAVMSPQPGPSETVTVSSCEPTPPRSLIERRHRPPMRADRRLSPWLVGACLVGILVLGMTAWYYAQISGDTRATVDHYQKGLVAFRERRWDDAAREFEAETKRNPRHADAYHMKGLAYAMSGAFDKSLPAYDEAIRLNPGMFGAYTNRGWARRMLKDFAGAIKDLDTVIEELKPPARHLDDAYLNRGDAFKEMGETDRGCLEKAAADYTEAITLGTENAARVYRSRADVNERLGRHQQADADLAKARELEARPEAER